MKTITRRNYGALSYRRTPLSPPLTPYNRVKNVVRTARRGAGIARDIYGMARGYRMAGPLGAAAYGAGAVTRRVGGYLLRKALKRGGKRKGVYQTAGKYTGRFKKAKKFKTGYNYYSNKGLVNTQETAGSVADPDCVYISAQAVDSIRIVQSASRALIRKLFQKAGFVISNMDELLISTSLTTAADWKVDLTIVNGKTGVETVWVSHTLVAASTCNSVSSAFENTWLEYCAGYANTGGTGNASVDTNNPKRLILYRQDYNTTFGSVFECEINLMDEILCIKGHCDLKVQNRTLSASGSGDAENVDNNPITGRLYEFSSIPKARSKAGYLLNEIKVLAGVQLVRAAQLTGQSSFKEPPLPTVFSNCSKSVKIRLDPGEIKHYNVAYQKSMHFLNFLKFIHLEYGTAGEFYQYNSRFPTVMVAFEDMINVNPTQNVTCAYECNKVLGVYFKTRKKALGVETFDQTQLNNVPA